MCQTIPSKLQQLSHMSYSYVHVPSMQGHRTLGDMGIQKTPDFKKRTGETEKQQSTPIAYFASKRK